MPKGVRRMICGMAERGDVLGGGGGGGGMGWGWTGRARWGRRDGDGELQQWQTGSAQASSDHIRTDTPLGPSRIIKS